jgi:dCMP deaminase
MRITWDEYFIKMANVAKLRSPDPKTKVGCILVSMKDHRIISSGFNGLPAGIPEDIIDWIDRPTVYKHIIHAESNCLLYANSQFEDTVLYTTLSPCINCVKILASSKVRRIVYVDKYRDFEETNELCKLYNIDIQQF